MDKIKGLKGQSFCTIVRKAVEPVRENIPGAVILLFVVMMAGSASTAATASSLIAAGTDGLTIQAVDHIAGFRYQDMLLSPGRLTAKGMHFEINDSNYLNITLDSSVVINITLESAPKMVTIKFESASGPMAAKITLGGFIPLTTYNKYEDNYHNLVSFQTDINGNYTYIQELSKPHFVFIQPEIGKPGYSSIHTTSYVLPSTIFIQDNATGGDCILVGTWNISSKTCTLTTDFASNIQIDNDNIVLDGNGHTITGNDAGNGVHLSGRNNVTIKDLNVTKFNGIFLYSSSNNMLSRNNITLNGGDGIRLWSSSNNNMLNNNNVSNNDGGIYLYSSSKNTLNDNNVSNSKHYGIFLSASGRNTLSNNNVLNNGRGYGIALAFDPGIPDSPSNNNTLSNNNVSNNNFTGIALFFSSNNILSNNIASKNNLSGIILYDSSSNNTLSNNNASNNNYNGISLNISSNNNILSNNNLSNNNNYGISLYDSRNNTIYNNYFNNMNNAFDNENSIWNITKTAGTNIIGGSWHGGNYWSDYAGKDTDGDGLGDTMLPYNSSGGITNGGDFLPLMHVNTPDNVALGKPAYASSSWYNTPPGNAFDGDWNSHWNSGGYAPAWIYVDLKQNYNLALIKLIVSQTPEGDTTHNIYISQDASNWTFVKTLSGYTHDSQILTDDFTPPLLNVRYVKVETVSSPSWIAWFEIEIYGNPIGPGDLNITSFSPTTSTVTNNEGEPRTFSITTNQIVNVSWLINGTEVFNETGVITSSYTNSSAELGTWNITAIASNANGTAMQTWDWNVTSTTPNHVHNINKGTSYTTIQAAIEDANPGDEINVDSGTYYENVNVSKQLILKGVDTGSGKPVVDAHRSDNAITLSAGKSTLEGFTAVNASWPKVGIYLNSNNNIVRNNSAQNNNYNGIELSGSSNNSLSGNNANSNDQYGIYLVDSSGNTLNGNIASKNAMMGIYLYSSVNNILNVNDAMESNGGIRLDYSDNNILISNNISNNIYGIIFSASSNNVIYNNYFSNANNALDQGNNIWNITKTKGNNIIGGSWLGGNYWSDYTGKDTDGDGLGDTLIPYNSSNNIASGGDYLPLTAASGGLTQIDSCTTISEPGEYVLNRTIINSDAMNCITITSSNVVFDGAGYIIDGIDAQDTFGFPLDTFGVFVYNSTTALINVTVKNLTATDWKSGVFYKNITDGMVENNTVTSNQYGIYLQFSSNNMLSNNNANFNRYDSIFLISSNNNTLSSNNVSNNDAGIRIDSSISNTFNRNIASGNNYGIILQFSNNNILSDNSVLNNDFGGIFLQAFSNNNTLSSNNALNNGFGGIQLTGSNNNTVSGNIASSERFSDGIFLEFSNNNTLSANNVSNNNRGIHLGASGASSNNNMINGNNALNNFVGIFLVSSSNNIVTNNNFSNNLYHGIEIYGDNNTLSSNNVSSNGAFGIEISANNNQIYNNYFLNNMINARDSGKNIWNVTKTAGTNIIGGSYLGGNYWSDYAGKDTDGDGLGDTLLPYNSSGNITDGGDFLPLTTSPTSTAGSISGFKINDTNGNGKWDAGEKGISNWTIRLIGITGKGKNAKIIRKGTLTDAMGFYTFDNLPAGRYFVIEKLKKGFVPTGSPVKRIKLAQDENSMNKNFTNRPVNRLDKIDSQSDVDYYEAINMNIDKNKEDMDWG